MTTSEFSRLIALAIEFYYQLNIDMPKKQYKFRQDKKRELISKYTNSDTLNDLKSKLNKEDLVELENAINIVSA